MTINNEQIQALKGNLVIDPYYLVECGNCAEIYPSNKLAGGCQIADTGDYGDCYCPHCDASEEYEDLGNNAASAWNYQQKRIDALLAERDADKALIAEQAKRIAELRDWNAGLAQESLDHQQRIAELEQRHCGGALMEREEHHVGVFNKLLECIAELEARTLTIKLPSQTDFDDPLSAYEAIKKCRDAFAESCAAAGITLVVGE